MRVLIMDRFFLIRGIATFKNNHAALEYHRFATLVGFSKGTEMFVLDWIKAVLKFFIVDSIVNILGDLFEQPLVMWVFIGWGWLATLVMLFSVYDTIGQL